MDINELLCVGRSRKSQSRIEHSTRTNKTLSRVGLHPEETSLNFEDWITGNRLIPSDPEDDTKQSAMYSSGYSTPPKKSILRGTPVSPKYGSPTSSSRSVRFSDRDRENETVFAKLHLNETTQTDHGHVHRTHHRSKPIICGKNKMHEELDLSDSQHIRTSTPRSGKTGETLALESLLPCKFEEKQTKMLSTSPKASEQKQHKEKIVIDIAITPKRSVKQSTEEGKTEQHKEAKCVKPDGHKIIQNMNFNEIMKPTEKIYAPDASKITQNMDLHNLNFNSTGTQTMSEASSPRSASPETPCHRSGFPDGSRIIRNLELSTPDTSIRMVSESIQTVDMESFEPEPKSKTVGIQTTTDDETPCDALSAPENERYRSKSMQTNLDMSDSSTESQDGASSRSMATQTQDKIPDIPDGASITKNMDIPNKSPKVVAKPIVEEVMRRSFKPLQHSSLNDHNWNEFVKHLEMFNPSPSCSSDSETDDEFPANLKSEPVIVYDSREHPDPVKVDTEQKRRDTRNSNVVQHRESQGAKKLLESEEFTRQQYESVLKEDELLQKLRSSYTQARSGTTKHEKQKVEPARSATNHNPATKKRDTTKPLVVTPIQRSNIQAIESSRPTTSIQTYVYRDNETETGNALSVPSESGSQRRASKDSLTFTPIETYSFNPDTLTKTTTNTGVHALPTKGSPLQDKSPSNDASLGTGVKESVTKNSYVQGVDLGPIFSTKSDVSRFDHHYSGSDGDRKVNSADYSSSSYSMSRSLSPKRYMQPTVSSTASARSYCFTPSRSRDSGYSYPLTTSSSSRLCAGSRPSSVPSSRSRGHPLSSSLREMRNTAVRKSAMSSLLDPKRKSSYDYGSSKYSSSNRSSSSTSGSFSQRYGTPYKSYEDYDRFTYSGSHKSLASKHNVTKNYTSSGYTEQLSSAPTTREYMNALNDISNARLERSRSRSRSPKYEPVRRSYDRTSTTSSRYSMPQSKISFDTDKEVETFVNKTAKDEGFVESVTTSRAHAPRMSPVVVEKHESKSDRRSRGLHRKPPLPTKSKAPRSRDSSKEKERSSRSPSREKIGRPSNDRVKPSPVVKEKIEHVSNTSSSKGGRRADSGDVPGDGTITIGSISPSVIDKACMFLGHETIQKIINEAKL